MVDTLNRPWFRLKSKHRGRHGRTRIKKWLKEAERAIQPYMEQMQKELDQQMADMLCGPLVGK